MSPGNAQKPIEHAKRVKRRPSTNGVSINGTQKAMARLSSHRGFGYQGAMLSQRGR